MDIDKTTLTDLSIFHQEEEFSIFHKLDFTRTLTGRAWLRIFFSEPFDNVARIRETQEIIMTILKREADWPVTITNGTIMVMDKFYETPIDNIPDSATPLNAYSYKIFHSPDYSLTKYSVEHFGDFVRSLGQLVQTFDHDDTPPYFLKFIRRAGSLLSDTAITELSGTVQGAKFSPVKNIYYGFHLRNKFKVKMLELIEIFGRFDAWYSMAMAVKKYSLVFPDFIDAAQPTIHATGLYHLLIPKPVSYDVQLDPQHNFLFLTGANMAGKSTFIRSIGAAVYLAHLGLGVPASKIEMTVFNGILSNINIEDNIAKGESYFFNEVQRIKNTIEKINNGRKWLVLIDELFKGTNVQDAMKCSGTVIRGLIRIPNSLFILSTHLYEIGQELKAYPNIMFRYFETTVTEDNLEFSYQLKEGISNDRIGYLILKREKVIEMLDKL